VWPGLCGSGCLALAVWLWPSANSHGARVAGAAAGQDLAKNRENTKKTNEIAENIFAIYFVKTWKKAWKLGAF
jgi:hypothetical protein